MNLNLWKQALLLIIFSITSDVLYAATYYSRASGNFTANTVWSLTRTGSTVNYPGTSHTYIIQNGHTITLSANQTAAAVTIESGGTLTPNNTRTLTAPLTIDSGGTLNVNTRQYTQTGSLINNGTITGTTGYLNMGASSLDNAGSITLTTGRITRSTGGTLVNSGSITMGAGQFTASSGSFTNEATGTLTITGTATVTLGTGNFVNNNTSSSVNFGSSAISVAGTAQSIGGFTTTGRFTASNTSGTITLTGDINAAGITKSGAGTLNMGTGLTHTSSNTIILTAGTMNGGSSTINVNLVSTTAWQGTASVFVPETSTVNFGAAGNQTLSATGTKTFYNLTLSNSGVKTIAGTSVNNILSMEGTATASTAPTYGATATLRYNTATGRTAGAEWLATFAATGGVIIDNTGAITTNGNKVFDLDVPLTINSGATLTPAAGNTFSFGGDLINDGTWTASTGAVTITLGRTSQSIGSFNTSGLVTMSKASGTATFTGDINGGAFTMNSAAGTLNLGTGLNHTFTGAWTNTAGILQGNTSTLNIGGTASGTGVTFTAGTSTVNFNGAGAQNIPAFSYYDLNTTTGGTKTLLGSTTVSNVLTINSGTTLSASSFTLTLPGSGSPFVNNGTFTAGTSTVNFNGSGAQNIPGLTYYNLNTSTGNTKTLQGNTTVNNVFTIGTGTTLAAGANTLNLSGAGTPLVINGTLTTGTSTVNFNGSGAQNIPAQTYYNLSTSNANTKTLQGTTTVSNVLTVNSGTTLAAGANTLNLSGSGTPFVSSGTFTAGTSTVNFNGSGAQNIPGLSYYNLNTSTGNTKTLEGNVTVSNVLTIGAGTTFSPGANTINLSLTGNPLVVNGTFTAGTSTVNFNGSGAQNIPAQTYYNLNTSTGNTKTLQGTTNVLNILTINTGTTLSAGANTLNLSRDGTPFVINGAFTPGTSTVNFNGSGAQNIPALTYYNLISANGDTKSLQGTTTISNVLTINASTTLDLGEYILNLSGSGTPLVNNGSFTCGTSTVNFTGTSSTNIPALNYYDLNLTGGPRVLANSGIIGIAGVFTPGAGGFTVAGSTVDFNGDTDQTIPAFTFFALQISGGGSKLIDSVVNVNEITIGDGAIVNLFSDGAGILNITNE